MGYSAVYLNGGYHNQFSSNDFYDCAIKTNKTYAVIHITGSSKYNNFNGGIYKSTTTTIPAYLYFEQNTACDYNLLSNWVATGLNANYSIQGVNTVNASNIFG
jgi:hypothetical protein